MVLTERKVKKNIKVAKRDGSSEINSQGNVDQQCTGPLSFHCQKREKPASRSALHTLGTTLPGLQPRSHGSTLNLERASQWFAPTDPAG